VSTEKHYNFHYYIFTVFEIVIKQINYDCGHSKLIISYNAKLWFGINENRIKQIPILNNEHSIFGINWGHISSAAYWKINGWGNGVAQIDVREVLMKAKKIRIEKNSLNFF
jgi:hypothetical protein